MPHFKHVAPLFVLILTFAAFAATVTLNHSTEAEFNTAHDTTTFVPTTMGSSNVDVGPSGVLSIASETFEDADLLGFESVSNAGCYCEDDTCGGTCTNGGGTVCTPTQSGSSGDCVALETYWIRAPRSASKDEFVISLNRDENIDNDGDTNADQLNFFTASDLCLETTATQNGTCTDCFSYDEWYRVQDGNEIHASVALEATLPASDGTYFRVGQQRVSTSEPVIATPTELLQGLTYSGGAYTGTVEEVRLLLRGSNHATSSENKADLTVQFNYAVNSAQLVTVSIPNDRRTESEHATDLGSLSVTGGTATMNWAGVYSEPSLCTDHNGYVDELIVPNPDLSGELVSITLLYDDEAIPNANGAFLAGPIAASLVVEEDVYASMYDYKAYFITKTGAGDVIDSGDTDSIWYELTLDTNAFDGGKVRATFWCSENDDMSSATEVGPYAVSASGHTEDIRCSGRYAQYLVEILGAPDDIASYTTPTIGEVTFSYDPDGDGDGYGETGYVSENVGGAAGDAAGTADCNDGDPAYYPGLTWYADADGDLFGDETDGGNACERAAATDVLDNTDCNDAVGSGAAINPGETEVIEISGTPVDENCDDMVLCYVDGDQDTYHAGVTVETANLTCGGATELTSDGASGDCDDTNPAYYPGLTWYADADGDLFGDETDGGNACERAAATDVLDNTDCDDTVVSGFSINTTGTEIAGDASNNDEDCSGAVECYEDGDNDGYVEETSTPIDGVNLSCDDTGEAYLSDLGQGLDCDDDDETENPGVTWYADTDEDTYGDPGVSNVCERAALDDVLDNTDCNDGDPTVYPTADELCDGQKNNCVGAMLATEVDDDDDQYVVCTLDPGGWDGTGTVVGGADCDDDASNTHPNITTLEVDNSICYRDADSDGWGDRWATGAVSQGTDCDDVGANANLTNPDATDQCGDSIDQNCDGAGGPETLMSNPSSSDYNAVDEDGDLLDYATETGYQNLGSSYTGVVCDASMDWCDYADCTLDYDQDLLEDDDEVSLGTDPNNTDSDADGFADYTEVTRNGGTVGSAAETDSGCATSGDDFTYATPCVTNGIIDALDSDDDGDGIPTATEAAATLEAGVDIQPWLNTDSDGDGFPDGYEAGSATLVNSDTDNFADAYDRDSDADTVADMNECGGASEDTTDCAGGLNTDGTGPEDRLDDDDDGDGVLTINEDPTAAQCTKLLALSVSGDTCVENNDPLDDDTDGDGLPNYLDNDDDADGVGTIDEDVAAADCDPAIVGSGSCDTCSGSTDCQLLDDADGDGLPNFLDNDDDADGIPTKTEGGNSTNSDTDDYPDYLDSDSDADGFTDLHETVTYYTDLDSDKDNVPDIDECGGASQDPSCSDSNSDTDGLEDRLDDDDDGDGILTKNEDPTTLVCSHLAPLAPVTPTCTDDSDPRNDDVDGDGLPNYLDTDDDNDGISTSVELAITSDQCDPDADIDGQNPVGECDQNDYTSDADGDKVWNIYDDDDDADGIATADEDDGGATTNSDSTYTYGDAYPDYLDSDSDADGFTDLVEGDPDYLDLDSDDDTVADVNECGGTDQDTTDCAGGPNTDGTGPEDRLDNDDDGDGVLTINEDPTDAQCVILLDITPLGGITCDDGDNPLDDDTDGDGLPNYLDNDDDADGVGTIDEDVAAADCDPAIVGSGSCDTCSGSTDCQLLDDADGDGLPNFLDNDDDADGIPTKTEGGNSTNSDTDDYLDYLDSDSDADGFTDLYETVTYYTNTDSDGDGVLDVNECGGAAAPNMGCVGTDSLDTDNDTIPDRLDNDDDGDGVITLFEDPLCPLAYVPLTPVVLANVACSNNDRPFGDDADGDGIDNYLDTDDDNDGIDTIKEMAITESQCDPAVGTCISNSAFSDADADGTWNIYDDDDDNDLIPTADEDDGSATRNSDLPYTYGDDYPDYLDSDSDADGFTDLVEGDPDYLDLDSDDDTVADVNECGGTDQDTDDCASGLNTDGTGPVDRLDNDDDGDGVLTINEDPTAAQCTKLLALTLPAGITCVENNDPLDDDTDGDGLPNYLDDDDDADGVGTIDEDVAVADCDKKINSPEGSGCSNSGGAENDDADKDGLPNFLDNDDDADGIPTLTEGGNSTNSDTDDYPNYLDSDSDADGFVDAHEWSYGGGPNFDGTDEPDYIDDDSDNDGVLDKYECGGIEEDTACTVDQPDSDFTCDGVGNLCVADGVEDRHDTDDDGDGVLTEHEDPNGNMCTAVNDTYTPLTPVNANLVTCANDIPADPTNDDADGDEIPNYLDTDDDNDGIQTSVELAITSSQCDPDLDGSCTVINPRTSDADNDGVWNIYDDDDDNDLIATADEDAGGATTNSDSAYTHGDAYPDYLDSDSDADGFTDLVEGDPDYLDLDSDDDTVADVNECGGTDQDTTDCAGGPNTDGTGPEDRLDNDDDGDGVLTINEDPTGAQCVILLAITPLGGITCHDGDNPLDDDTDGDGLPNYLDTDDDDDSVFTIDEDVAAAECDPAIIGNTPSAPSGCSDSGGAENDDADADGLPNFLDNDDDGDGIASSYEVINNLNPDGDAYADYLDSDSDDDGFTDAHEWSYAGGPNFDGADEDDYLDDDSDNDGVDDKFECGGIEEDTACVTDNSDSTCDGVVNDCTADTVEDRHDTDDDGDGILTATELSSGCIENNGPDACTGTAGNADGDGTVNYLDLDSDNDGFTDRHEDDVDTDGQGDDDYVDFDSDNDEVLDILECGGTNEPDECNDASVCLVDDDCDGTGVAENRLDTDDDDDGILTSVELTAGCTEDNGSDACAGIVGDADADGVWNYLDLDSDDDGFSDAHEYTEGNSTDFDGEGDEDYVDYDSDDDGVLDIYECGGTLEDQDPRWTNITACLDSATVDSDGTQKEDRIDVDDDGDGISTAIEIAAGCVEDFGHDTCEGLAGNADGDERANHLDLDSDNDGFADEYEGDTDSDSLGDSDYVDYDSDQDTLADIYECGGTEQDTLWLQGDGSATTACTGAVGDGFNSDSDGLEDRLDADDDEDGIDTEIELVAGCAEGTAGSYDECLDNLGNSASVGNADGDSLPNYLDLDSDDDGFTDLLEADGDTDTYGDADYIDFDSDQDGVLDADECGGVNADGRWSTSACTDDDFDDDSVVDRLDVDDDNDGIDTVIEQAAGCVEDTGYDACAGEAGNADGDAFPNHLDLDSDADGFPDTHEWETGAVTDYDSGGDADFVDYDSDGDTVLDINECGGETPDSECSGSNTDFACSAPVKCDSDSDEDRIDQDDDGDSVLTIDEDPATAACAGISTGSCTNDADPTNDDTDGDGLVNYLDTDDDDDAVQTIDEDVLQDICDLLSTSFCVGDGDPLSDDTDEDDVPNFLDTDDDGDTVLSIDEDVTESICNEMFEQQDGVVLTANECTSGVFENGDPMDDDTDGDGIPNYLDDDDDNDGYPSAAEIYDGVTDPLQQHSDGASASLDFPIFQDEIPDFLDSDDDNDGIDTYYERLAEASATGAWETPDNDFYHRDDDSDDDGVYDGAEWQNWLVENSSISVTCADGQPYDGRLTVSSSVKPSFDAQSGEWSCSFSSTDAALIESEDMEQSPAHYYAACGTTSGLSKDDPWDRDCDGVPNFADTDDDGDGRTSVKEGAEDVGEICGASVGSFPKSAANPGDGIPNYLDFDSDDADENDWFEMHPGGVSAPATDFDNDGTPDYLDCDNTGNSADDDGDGMLNSIEQDLCVDIVNTPNPSWTPAVIALLPPASGDLEDDWCLNVSGNGTGFQKQADSDGDTVPDNEEVVDWTADPVDYLNTTASSAPDIYNIDDDGDGIPTAEEANPTCGSGTPTLLAQNGVLAWYCDGAGTLAEYQNTDANQGGAYPLNPDTIPDYLDDDDDGDGKPTAAEDVDGNGVWDDDSDGDLVYDYLDPNDSDGADGDGDGDGFTNAEEAAIDPSCVYRSDCDGDGVLDVDEVGGDIANPQDTDDDGIVDVLDTDDDGDGIGTLIEGSYDTDGDGIPNYLDLDSDGDGESDAVESLDGTDIEADPDCDGIYDYLDAVEDDGPCMNVAEEDTGTPAPPSDDGCSGCANTAGVGSFGLWVILMAGVLTRRREQAA